MNNISLNPPILFNIGNIGISNALFTSFIITMLIGSVGYYLSRNISLYTNKKQAVTEFIVEYFYKYLMEIYKDKQKAIKHLTLILSLFIFIFIANQFTLIPLTQSIILNGVEVFKNPTAHLSQTLALSLIVVIICQYIAISSHPIKHINTYIKFNEFASIRKFKDIPNVLLEQFLGILDIISEIAKIVSLACRLFGNVFAGEIMIIVISSLSIFTAFIVPVPFYVISIFSGIIQALVFAFLSLSFLTASAKT